MAFRSLAQPAYVVLLYLNFRSVLRLGLRYVSGISPSKFSASKQRTDGAVENNGVKVSSLRRTSSRTVFGLFTACAQRDSRPNVSNWLWQIQSGTGQIQ